MKRLFARIVTLLSALWLYPAAASAQTQLIFQIAAGRDDQRGGNPLYAAVERTDGTLEPEQLLSRGLSGGRSMERTLVFPGTFSPADVKAIHLRHDGRRRAGHPFDHPDNFDLRSLRVVQPGDGASQPDVTVYDSLNDSVASDMVKRFTGGARWLVVQLRPEATQPDFVIEQMTRRTDGRLSVRVRNIGPAAGILTSIACSSIRRHASLSVDAVLDPGSTRTVSPNITTLGEISCSVFGVDEAGRPEAVTANNRRVQRL